MGIKKVQQELRVWRVKAKIYLTKKLGREPTENEITELFVKKVMESVTNMKKLETETEGDEDGAGHA